eukprot:scaffold2078_cov181-Pinguiococcus_pyrenoidosus.AAC.3
MIHVPSVAKFVRSLKELLVRDLVDFFFLANDFMSNAATYEGNSCPFDFREVSEVARLFHMVRQVLLRQEILEAGFVHASMTRFALTFELLALRFRTRTVDCGHFLGNSRRHANGAVR